MYNHPTLPSAGQLHACSIIKGLAKDCSISSALAMEILHSSTKASLYHLSTEPSHISQNCIPTQPTKYQISNFNIYSNFLLYQSEHDTTTVIARQLYCLCSSLCVRCQYCKTSCKSRTKSQNLNVSPLSLQLSLLNPMKPGVKSSMKM